MSMRHLIDLVEAWDQTIRVRGEDVETFRNPSRGAVLKMIKESGGEPLRGDIVWDSQDLLVWNSTLAVHSDMMTHYGMSELYLYLHPWGMQMNDIQYHREDDDGTFGQRLIRRMVIAISNPNILRIYPRPLVQMLDNDTGEMHEVTPDLIEALKQRPVERLSELELT